MQQPKRSSLSRILMIFGAPALVACGTTDPDTNKVGEQAEPPSGVWSSPLTAECPAGARFATNGSNLAFCLFEGFSLPNSPKVEPYCHYLKQGYFGFSWTQTAASSDYTCPAGAYHTTNGAGTAFCIFDSSQAPPWSSAYCNHLSSGYIGYSWMTCPSGARYTTNGAGTAYCLFENLRLPAQAQPYCDYLANGYEGFSFPLNGNANYTCPQAFKYYTNGAGSGFCLVTNLTIPQALNVRPYCQYLKYGYMGFHWQENP